MEKKIVIFAGQDKDNYGMPHPFYLYGVFVSQRQIDQKYNVTVMGLSEDTPAETLGSQIISAQSATEAVNKIIAELERHSKNNGLKKQVCDLTGINL
jgi:hypothetical protein